MKCVRWKSTRAPRTRMDNPRQVFGAKTVLRSRLVAAVAAGVLVSTVAMVGAVVTAVVVEHGPNGGLLIAHNTEPRTDEALFDVEVGADEHDGYRDHRVPSVSTPETAQCSDRQPAAGTGREVYAFSRMNAEWMEMSLARSCQVVDVLMPNWFTLGREGLRWGSPYMDIENNPQHVLSPFRQGFELLPVVQLSGLAIDRNFWQEPLWAREVAAQMYATVDRLQLRGMCLDLTAVPRDQLSRLEPVLWMVAQIFGETAAESCIIADSEVLHHLREDQIGLFDTVVVPAFNRRIAADVQPQPLASQAWFEQLLEDLSALVPQERLVLMLGAGAYEWQGHATLPREMDFGTAIQRVTQRNGTVRFSAPRGNSFAIYLGADGQRHQSWILDAASAYNQMLIARQRGVGRIGLWGLGMEDPAVWKLFRSLRSGSDLAVVDIEVVDLSETVRYIGSGPFLDFQDRGRVGYREVSTDGGSGLINRIHYAEMPRPYSVNRWGSAEGRVISLTFDDGPSAEYTGAILDILAARGVSATFFPVGSHMIGETGILRRVLDEGHTLGGHTFLHPDLTEIGPRRLLAEVKAQSHVFGNLLGVRPVLFRAPYVRGPGPIRGAVAEQMLRVDEQGYLIAGSDIVPPDWAMSDPAQIVRYVVDAVEAGQGQVILLHDGGGDRNATVEALPLIIETLEARGYSFTDLAGLAGFSHHDFMPSVRRSPIPIEATLVTGLGWLMKSFPGILLLVVGLRLARGLILFVSALKRGRVQRRAHPRFRPDVTVIVPAYNEEKVIERTVRSILASRYRKLSVLVVNDGSNDATEAVVRRAFRRNKRVRVISQANQGKWRAANRAIQDVTTEFVVMVDADTLVDPQAIGFLVQGLADPEVGAVAGNVKVGNDKGIMTRLQALEYTTAQNIDRRAFELVNGIMVVPGAIGAWRTAAIRQVGLYSGDTLTEDADLTVSLLRAGFRVRFDERAFTYTEAPETVSMFLRQRLRWTLGMIQTAWKHKGSFGRQGAIGRLVLPDFLLFGVLMSLLTPIVDLIIIWTLAGAVLNLLAGEAMFGADTSAWALGCYIALPLLEAMMVACAVRLDGRASYWWMLYLPLQRLVYTPLLTLTLYRALWRAMTGRLAKWSKATRAASVRAPFAPAFGPALVAGSANRDARGSHSL